MKKSENEKALILLELLKIFDIKASNKNLTELEKVVPCIKDVHRDITVDKKQCKLF